MIKKFENNILTIKINELDELPFIYQPNNPNGKAWISEAEAFKWADALIFQIENDKSTEFPIQEPLPLAE